MDFEPILSQAAPAANGGPYDLLFTIAPILMVLPIWYFLVISPQQKRAASHKQMIDNVRRGDTVVTTGGIIAKVIRVVDENEVQAEIADGVRVRLLRQMISDVRSRSDSTSKDAA
jgi:preprotein translocase subunit YajC